MYVSVRLARCSVSLTALVAMLEVSAETNGVPLHQQTECHSALDVFMWHTVQVPQQHGITLCCVRLWRQHAPLAAVACTHFSITICVHQPCMLHLCALVSTTSYLCLSTKAFPVSKCAHRIMCLLALALAAWASFAVWGWCGCGSAPQAMHACIQKCVNKDTCTVWAMRPCQG